MARFTFTPGSDLASGSISITDYHIVQDSEGNPTLTPMEGWGTRTYQDSDTNSFAGWYNGTMLRTIDESERVKNPEDPGSLVGSSHFNFGFNRYQEGNQLAINK